MNQPAFERALEDGLAQARGAFERTFDFGFGLGDVGELNALTRSIIIRLEQQPSPLSQAREALPTEANSLNRKPGGFLHRADTS